MPISRCRLGLAAAWLFFNSVPLCAANDAVLPESLRGVNPDMLSGGLFAVLDAEGAFGPRATPPRARASYPDLSKGRPPAVLDARVGANVRLGDDPDPLPAHQRGQAEPHIVRSSANPAILLATFQEGRFSDSGAINCGYAVSHDGGFTWTRALIPNLTAAGGGRFIRASDPVAGAGPQGDLYLQTLASTTGTFGRPAVVLNRSTDGGATWSAPFSVYEPASDVASPDKNWLAVNEFPGSPNFGRLVSTWTNFNYSATGTLVNTPILASFSDDRGVTWSGPVDMNPLGNNHQGTQPVFLPDGSLVVPFIRFIDVNLARFTIQCKRSVDGGRTFPGTATTIATVVEGWDDPDLRDGVFLPSVAVARQTGVIFITNTEVVAGSPRVVVRRSTDRSVTWSAPVIASDQPAGVSVMNATIAVTPDGLNVAVVFNDKRHAADGRNFVDNYAALSFNGGLTWEPSFRLTEMSSDIRYAPLTSRGYMLGDYMGLAPPLVPGQPFVSIWCDTRTGDSDPFTVNFLPVARPTYAAWASIRGLRTDTDHLDDTDGDGVSNYLEYLSGTNPLKAESGHDLVVRASSPTTVDVAWTERTDIQKLFTDDGVAVVPAAAFAEGAFSAADVIKSSLDAELLPATDPGFGVAWTGVRLTLSASEAQFITRAYRHDADLPATTSGASAAVNTNARLVNLSTRGVVQPGSPLIVGFVIDGNKSVLVRAAGPALTSLGVAGALANPQLTLAAAAPDLPRTNDNWSAGGANSTDFARLGAFPFAANSLDAALLLPLGSQAYTATAAEVGGTRGITLVEAYDADATPGRTGAARMVNLSTRGETGPGDNALIAGFVIAGTQPRRVLVRAVGPSLTAFDVRGALADPVLTIYQGGTELATNDDWEISRSSAAIAATTQRVGAFALGAGSRDAALLLTLPPGAYTTVITGADGGTGIALIEIYDAD